MPSLKSISSHPNNQAKMPKSDTMSVSSCNLGGNNGEKERWETEKEKKSENNPKNAGKGSAKRTRWKKSSKGGRNQKKKVKENVLKKGEKMVRKKQWEGRQGWEETEGKNKKRWEKAPVKIVDRRWRESESKYVRSVEGVRGEGYKWQRGRPERWNCRQVVSKLKKRWEEERLNKTRVEKERWGEKEESEPGVAKNWTSIIKT